ncbi:hypothetical protein SAMN04487948_105400 [Halogranum amylolyticum]|uniref:Dolichyl-phosphate-mannose-protein mannosyltransferase n=1 Tax=Halogranum amylolyticum TaxID=660520 RepID=A0A1H8SYU2_9EURY|nr:hypothetical protein [Halogranum amylolyticum]SEO83675.1 hypothetical protein SAMN04487948_105400 [Halogranum amylolyticum]
MSTGRFGDSGLSLHAVDSRVVEAVLVAVITVANLWVVTTAVFGRWFPPNDAKHWLVRARYFAGWAVPPSESVGQFATHPVAIVPLSLLLLVFGSAVLAAKVWAITAFLWTTLTVYVTARELFSAQVAVLAFAFVSLGQSLFFDLLAFGGVPQLVSVGFLTLSVGALVRARRTGRRADRVTFALLFLLGLLAHPPSSPVYPATLGTAAVGLAVLRARWRPVVETLVDVTLPSLFFLGYLASQWHIFSLYTATAGGHDFAVLLQKLGRDPVLEAMGLALVVLAPLVGYALYTNERIEGVFDPQTDRREDSARREATLTGAGVGAVVLGWLLGPLMMAAVVSNLPGVSTELARVAFYLAPPIAIGAAVTVGVLAWTAGRFVTDREGSVVARRTAAVVLALLVVVPGFYWSTGYYDGARDYYEIKNGDSVGRVVEWVDQRQPFGGTVAGPFYVVSWVEGVTGQNGLTRTPAGGSYRPNERRESAAFQTLEDLRWHGATPENVADAKAIIREYDVRYVVVPNNWRQTRFDSLGTVVFRTDELVVVEIDPTVRNTAPPSGGDA